MQKKEYKHTRPSHPFPEAVLVNIDARANILLGTFKDFTNDERRESRRNEIVGRFHEEVMKAHRKFRDNDRCSYESYVNMFLESAMKHYVRHEASVLEKERVTVSADIKLDPSDRDSPTFASSIPDSDESLIGAIADFDYREIVAMMRTHYPVCARILELHREGYRLSEIRPLVGISEDRLYDVMWPKAKRIFVRLHNFSANS